MPQVNGHSYRFGEFRLDPVKRVLWRGDEIVQTTPKSVEVLVALVERRGDVLTRDELLEKVWRDSFVEEANINFTISNLRRALGPDGKTIIQTVPRRGYRFAGEIEDLTNEGRAVLLKRETVSEIVIHDEEVVVEKNRLLSKKWTVLATVTLLPIFLLAFLVWTTWTNKPVVTDVKSVAILPLQSADNSLDDNALRFGIADALFTGLGRVSDARVISAYRNGVSLNGEPSEIGKRLGAEAVLEGSLQQTNGRLRVTLRLIRSSDGFQLWSESFDGDASEILGLQDRLAAESASALGEKLRDIEKLKRPTTDLEAYRLFLKGDYLLRLRGIDNAARSIDFFKQAVAIDPSFARAWTGMAEAQALGTEVSEAENNVNQALQLDPDLADAYAVRGFIRMFHYWDWRAAEANLRRAVELDPNSIEAHHWLAIYLELNGRFDEAKTAMSRAMELDPISVNILSDMGQLHYLSREYEQAEEYCKRALDLDPQSDSAHGFLVNI